MGVKRTKPQSLPPLEAQVEALEKLLRQQMEDHRALREVLAKQEQAVRQAAVADLVNITGEQQRLVNHLAEVERHRVNLAMQISRQIDSTTAEPLPVSRIAESLEQPQRSRLMETAEELRGLVEDVRQRSSVVRAATEALSRHVTGLVQSVSAALSRAGVYSRRGRVNMSETVPASVDVTS